MPEHTENATENRPRTDTDASAGWEAEYAYQAADPELRADGGDPPERAPLSAFTDGGRAEYVLPSRGDRVRDRDRGDELVVVDVDPETRAGAYEIDGLGGATVADANPAYDAAAPVVEAVYAEEAADSLDGWRSVEDLRDAVAFGALRSYTFPCDRLASVAEEAR
jgi:hypothetical protein